MLVISRKSSSVGALGSTFMVGDAKVIILESVNGKVKLGIVADRDVPILRDEHLQTHHTLTQGCEHEPAR